MDYTKIRDKKMLGDGVEGVITKTANSMVMGKLSRRHYEHQGWSVWFGHLSRIFTCNSSKKNERGSETQNEIY